MKRALIIGAGGTIGGALVDLMASRYELHTLDRTQTDYSEESLASWSAKLNVKGEFHTIICCIGTLHSGTVAPEKRLSQITHEVLAEYFRVNAILPALCLKAFSSLLSKTEPSRFTILGAMVGSIGDNALGGWYGYRSSKAALNMLVKTAAIELTRTHKHAAVCVIHPGTTQGPLSRPFSSGVNKDKYYSPQQSATRILAVTESLQAENTGAFYNWDGSQLPW